MSGPNQNGQLDSLSLLQKKCEQLTASNKAQFSRICELESKIFDSQDMAQNRNDLINGLKKQVRDLEQKLKEKTKDGDA